MSTFTTRDLALLLPDQLVGDAYGLRHTDIRDGATADGADLLKPKVDNSKKVTRYFPGKAPTWAGEGGSGAPGSDRAGDEGDDDVAIAIDRSTDRSFKPAVVADRRLARLAQATSSSSSSSSAADGADGEQPRRRRVYEAEVIVDDDDDATAALAAVGGEAVDDESAAAAGRGNRGMPVGRDEEDEDDVAVRRARALKRLAEQVRLERHL